jgi:hypothetical protein
VNPLVIGIAPKIWTLREARIVCIKVSPHDEVMEEARKKFSNLNFK